MVTQYNYGFEPRFWFDSTVKGAPHVAKLLYTVDNGTLHPLPSKTMHSYHRYDTLQAMVSLVLLYMLNVQFNYKCCDLIGIVAAYTSLEFGCDQTLL